MEVFHMATRVVDYCQYITKLKLEALETGRDHICLSARDLHKSISVEMPTVPTCCSAMKSMMLEGDIYIQNPITSCGSSINLVIQYNLQNMEQRSRLNIPKKKGRKRKVQLSPLSVWLDSHAFPYKKSGNLYQVELTQGTWIIYAVTRHESDFNKVFIKSLHSISNNYYKLSISSPKNKELKRGWEKAGKVMKNRLNLTLLIFDDKGTIKEYH